MKATLSIDVELHVPALVGSATELAELHPGQIRSISVRIEAVDEVRGEPVSVEALPDLTRVAMRDLIALARASQPEGTRVAVWYQGRSERFEI